MILFILFIFDVFLRKLLIESRIFSINLRILFVYPYTFYSWKNEIRIDSNSLEYNPLIAQPPTDKIGFTENVDGHG